MAAWKALFPGTPIKIPRSAKVGVAIEQKKKRGSPVLAAKALVKQNYLTERFKFDTLKQFNKQKESESQKIDELCVKSQKLS